MQQVNKTLKEVQNLYAKVVGRPAPEIPPDVYVPFPHGVDPVAHVVREVDQLKQLTDQAALSLAPASWVPPADSFVSEDAYVIRLEIPGTEREDIKVFVAGGECVVRGERKVPRVAEPLRPMTLERPIGPFERRFVLPANCKPGAVEASFENGILELRMNLIEASRMPEEMKVEVA